MIESRKIQREQLLNTVVALASPAGKINVSKSNEFFKQCDRMLLKITKRCQGAKIAMITEEGNVMLFNSEDAADKHMTTSTREFNLANKKGVWGFYPQPNCLSLQHDPIEIKSLVALGKYKLLYFKSYIKNRGGDALSSYLKHFDDDVVVVRSVTQDGAGLAADGSVVIDSNETCLFEFIGFSSPDQITKHPSMDYEEEPARQSDQADARANKCISERVAAIESTIKELLAALIEEKQEKTAKKGFFARLINK